MRTLLLQGILLFSFCLSGQSQTEKQEEFDLKRLRVSLDLGFPNLAGVNGEYVLPKLNFLSVGGDFSYLPVTYSETKALVTYYSLGPNFYLSKKAKGLYLGANYGRMNISSTQIEGETVNLSVNFSTLNPKLGFKLGNKYFLKAELGYTMAFYNIDEANSFLKETYGVTITPELDYLQFWNGKLGVGLGF